MSEFHINIKGKDYPAQWRNQLRAEHSGLAQRMIDNAANRSTEGSLKDQIYNILDEHIDPMPTSKEEWNELKAEAIVKMLKRE